MNSLEAKKIIVAITGSIAAYKASYLIRHLIKKGAEVKVVMTEAATLFISPLTISTLSKNEVMTSVIDESSWNNHVELGLWADAMIVAPATATTLAKMANGISDSIVTAVYLSAKCPVFFAPAMDLDMWKHPATQANVTKLQSYGNRYLAVGNGELASGLVGEGRMMEPEEIIENISSYFAKKKDLINKKVLITAGPTFEKLDPVRFIGNHSSGKMGLALAEECVERGAEVNLVLGPNHLKITNPAINVIPVVSCEEMYNACSNQYEESDIAIFAAAVGDYRPKEISDKKIKKSDDQFDLVLERTTDIAASLGKQKKQGQINIGFALETNNEEANAQRKIVKKNFDFIVLNSLNDKGAGFKLDTNKITIIDKHNNKTAFELKSKRAVAIDIVNAFVPLLN